MIVKVKHDTDNPSVFVVENPAIGNEYQVDLFAKFMAFKPTVGKSYSANLTHKWETLNRDSGDHVLVHFVVEEGRAIDDIN